MTATPSVDRERELIYPESDGQPIADNTLQFRWIVTIQGGFSALYRDDPNVFVAGDLLWYPAEGQPKVRQAPDTMVVYGRPKGERGSYYDPDHGELDGYLRDGDWLSPISAMQGWISPRSKVRFDLDGMDLVLIRPDGERFKSYLELDTERQEAERARAAAENARAAAEERAAVLAARLRALGIDPDNPNETE